MTIIAIVLKLIICIKNFLQNENDEKRTKEPSIKETEIKQACNEKDKVRT